jgi:hypothetical protein
MASIFSTPKTPALPPPTLMPDPNDELRRQKARQQMALKSGQGGRASTFNTLQQGVVTGTEKLGVK